MERYELINGIPAIEILRNGDKIAIKFKEWQNTRYYVTRAGEQIGWIAMDLSEVGGKTSTNTHYLNLMVKAMKEAENER